MKIMERLRNAFKRKNLRALKKISNQAIERAALTEDPDLVNISIIAYAFYKLLSKQHIFKSDQWERFIEDVDADMGEAMGLAKKGVSYGPVLEKDIIVDIAEIDESLGNYVQDIIQKARVKQASRIYAMGLSLDKAISLTGADRYQLLSYIGSTVIHDRPFTRTKSILDRYEKAKKLLEESE